MTWLGDTKSGGVFLFSGLLGVARMAVQISSSKSPGYVLLRDWLVDLDVVLGRGFRWHPVGEFESVCESWGRLLVSSCVLRGWYRGGGHELLRARSGDPVWAYMARCLGHRLDRRAVLGSPRVAVLCAWAFFDGSWLDCEGVLGGDHVACYLYSGVRGGLPRALHNRLVLEGGGEVLVRYLRDFC